MASIANALSFHFLLLILLSLSLQPHARESKFFTKFTRYLSSAPTNILSPAPAPVLVPVIEPVLAPTPAPAPAPAEEDNGYGLYGRGSSDFSSEEFYTTNNGTPEKKESLGADEYKSESDTSFEKLLSGENYSNNNNGYSSNNGNGYSTSVNENNGYTNNNEMGYDGYNQNENGYMSSENKFNGDNQNTFSNNGNGYSNSINENNGYKADSYSQNNYNNEDNRYSSSMNQYNGYNNNNNEMSFENEKIGDNGNGYTNSEEENNGYNSNNRYVMGQQQGLSDTRFLENGKYSYDANNNGNDHETSYEEEVSDNGEGYYRNNEDSRYEFDSMGLQGKQRGLVKGGP